jgi:putative membrane protein
MLKIGPHIIVGCTALLMFASASAQTPMPPSAEDFVMAASQSDQYEIEAARVATAQSRNPRVVSFAQMMIQEHTRMSADLRAAASASKLPAPDSGMSSDQATLLSSLQSERGTDFDKTYARQQVLAHEQAKAVVGSYATAGSDANLRKTARSAFPTIRQHLEMAQKLAGQLGVAD